MSNPLALTRAYAARFASLGGVFLTGDARTLVWVNLALRSSLDDEPTITWSCLRGTAVVRWTVRGL